MINVLVARTELAEEQLVSLQVLLPSWRQEACQRLRLPQARAACILAYSLLSVAWQQISTEPLPEVIVDSAGKPRFQEDNGWYFSFSHRDGWVAVALGDVLLGVDIHGRIPWNKGLFERIASPLEQQKYAELEKRNDLAILWTRKEALAKKDGGGLSRSLADLDTLTDQICTWVSTNPWFALSLAAADPKQANCSQYTFETAELTPLSLSPTPYSKA